MKPTIELEVMLTEPQAERLQERFSALPFKVTYQEEQHGATLLVRIGCTPPQEKTVREILQDVGASISPMPDE